MSTINPALHRLTFKFIVNSLVTCSFVGIICFFVSQNIKWCPLCSSEPSSTQTETSEREGEDTSETGDVHSQQNDSIVEQPDLPAPSEKNTSFEQDNGESSSSSSGMSDGEGLPSDKQVASSSSNSPDMSTEGDADNSNSTETAIEPGEHD